MKPCGITPAVGKRLVLNRTSRPIGAGGRRSESAHLAIKVLDNLRRIVYNKAINGS